MDDSKLSTVLEDVLTSSYGQHHGYEGNITDALFTIGRALSDLAVHVKYLGNGDAGTRMGAIEAFGMHIGEKLDRLANAIEELGEK
jgi:hypothetical protein